MFSDEEPPVHPSHRARRRGFTLIEMMIVVAIVGVLAVIGVYGVRRYLASAKTAEARNALGQISKDAIASYSREQMGGAIAAQGTSTAHTVSLCDSASVSVPSSAAGIKGTRYQPDTSAGKDWNADATANKGFACLRFAMDQPHYYMYSYTASNLASGNDAFEARAHGDLDGDGSLSTFAIVGKVQNHALNVAPVISESSPDE